MLIFTPEENTQKTTTGLTAIRADWLSLAGTSEPKLTSAPTAPEAGTMTTTTSDAAGSSQVVFRQSAEMT